MFGRIIRKIKSIIYVIFHPRFRKVVFYDVPTIYFVKNLQIGECTHINGNVFINAIGGVKIGKNCIVSQGVSIFSTGLDIEKWSERDFKKDGHVNKEVIIGDNVWLCANVTLCPGAVIEDDVVVAAGSVVCGHLKKGYLYGGVPAKEIRRL